MKYKYSIETKYFNSGTPFIIMRFSNELELITSFLSSEVHSRASSIDICSALNDAIDGNLKQYGWAGNIYRLDITPISTTITNQIDSDGEEPCVIETSELEEIIEIWLAEKERLRSSLKRNVEN